MLGKTEGKRKREQQKMNWLDGISGHEFEETQGNSEQQDSYSSWGHKELHMAYCQGPAPADPGYSKRGRRRQLIYL